MEPKKTQIYRTDLPIVLNVGDSFLDQADKSKNAINFLGFTFDGAKVSLRAKTVSKYYYRMYRKARVIAGNPNQKGKDHLYERYSERGARTGIKKRGIYLLMFKELKPHRKSSYSVLQNASVPGLTRGIFLNLHILCHSHTMPSYTQPAATLL